MTARTQHTYPQETANSRSAMPSVSVSRIAKSTICLGGCLLPSIRVRPSPACSTCAARSRGLCCYGCRPPLPPRNALRRPRHPRPMPLASLASAPPPRSLEPMIDLWRDHRPDLLWAATARFLDDLAQSARSHGVRVLYAVRDIPLPPADCAAASARRSARAHAMRIYQPRHTSDRLVFASCRSRRWTG